MWDICPWTHQVLEQQAAKTLGHGHCGPWTHRVVEHSGPFTYWVMDTAPGHGHSGPWTHQVVDTVVGGHTGLLTMWYGPLISHCLIQGKLFRPSFLSETVAECTQLCQKTAWRWTDLGVGGGEGETEKVRERERERELSLSLYWRQS